MKKPDGTIDLEKIKVFLKEKKFPEDVVCMEQVHGGTIATVSDNKQEIIPGVDGLITSNKKLTLAVLTADCLPVLFKDPKKQIIAVAHAGSKGLLLGIITNVLNELKTKFNCAPADIEVNIGPSIEPRCYEVKEDYLRSFRELLEGYQGIYFTSNNKFYLDLRIIALQSLLKAGILETNIHISKECTRHASYTYYSYRGGDLTNRFVSVISL